MSLHESVLQDMARVMADLDDVSIISPTTLALRTLSKFGAEGLDSRIKWASLEHLKDLARRMLRGRFDVDASESPAYDSQGELFTGHLQDRYPTPRRGGDGPVYKLRDLLTEEEIAWNIKALRASARARLAHADALEAWAHSRAADVPPNAA
jgi:hypothetical protein